MSISKTLERAKIAYIKRIAAAAESLDLADFLSDPHSLPAVVQAPFPHIVWDDVLLPEKYAIIEELFRTTLARGTSRNVHDGSIFHAFDMDYDGYKFGPRPPSDESHPLYLFFSVRWNLLFSKVFNQLTTLETSLAFHHHPVGDRTGFIHNDFADKYFDPSSRLKNLVIPHDVKKPEGNAAGNLVVEKRIIAILYYLANPPWKEGDGGETGLYDSYSAAGPIIRPALRNNRLVAFHISNRSLHAFQSNRLPRNSIVQWFHLPEHLL